MTIIQIILTVFALFGFGAAVSRFRRGNMGMWQLTLWSILWSAILAVVLRPEIAVVIANKFGVGRGTDVVVYLAIASLFYMQFRLFARTEDQERQITKLARELALKDLKE